MYESRRNTREADSLLKDLEKGILPVRGRKKETDKGTSGRFSPDRKRGGFSYPSNGVRPYNGIKQKDYGTAGWVVIAS